MGLHVLKGHFFLRDNIIDATYKLDTKIAMVYANTVRAICGELRTIKRRRETLFRLSQHNMKRLHPVFRVNLICKHT